MTVFSKPYIVTVVAFSAVLAGGIALWYWSRPQHTEENGVKQRRMKDSSVHLVTTLTEWETCLPRLKHELEKMKILGLDCEWVFKHRVALLQLSTQTGYCVLVRLCCMEEDIPESLRILLADRSILKVGVAVRDDAKKLMRDYSIAVVGCIDLRHILTRIRGVYMCRSWGLQGLAKTVLDVKLSKEHAIRCGNWEARRLSPEQVEYAAADAIVAADIFTNLILAKVLGKDPRLHPSEAQAVSVEKFWATVRSLCQGIVDVGYKFYNGQESARGRQKKQSARKQNGEAYSTRKRPLWDNCQLTAPDGQLLCTCDTRKAKWYIDKGLGDKVSDWPFTVQLRFEPSSRPKSRRNYYLQDKENVCVVCGTAESYARKFVVPQEYRKYFPHLLKEHTSHDVLLMCPPCHRRSSDYDGAMRLQLAEECNAPLDSGKNSRVWADRDLQQVRSAGRALRANREKIPPSRVEELEKVLYDFYGVPALTPELLEDAANIDTKQQKDNFVPHARRVVDYMAQHGSLLEFQARWRRHFISTMQPKFLPAYWSVDYVPENWGDQVGGGDADEMTEVKEDGNDFEVEGMTEEKEEGEDDDEDEDEEAEEEESEDDREEFGLDDRGDNEAYSEEEEEEDEDV